MARCKMSGQVKREGEKKKVALFPGSWGQAVRLDSFLSQGSLHEQGSPVTPARGIPGPWGCASEHGLVKLGPGVQGKRSGVSSTLSQ